MNKTKKTMKAALRTLAVFALASGFSSLAEAGGNGTNLPPTQGRTNDGAFAPGIYSYGYDANYINAVGYWGGFDRLRLPINLESGNDYYSRLSLWNYLGNVYMSWRGLICMFDTLNPGESGHGDGRINNAWHHALMWREINNWFGWAPDVRYEIFNEPAGYGSNVRWYMDNINYIIYYGYLPQWKCVVDGTGYAGNVQNIRYEWSDDLGYHFYPGWLQGGSRTQFNYSNTFQNAVSGVSYRTRVTEFGARLDLGNRYTSYNSGTDNLSANVNTLRGIHDAVIALRNSGQGIKGLYHWHGWNNGDTFAFWPSNNSYGADKIRSIQHDD